MGYGVQLDLGSRQTSRLKISIEKGDTRTFGYRLFSMSSISTILIYAFYSYFNNLIANIAIYPAV